MRNRQDHQLILYIMSKWESKTRPLKEKSKIFTAIADLMYKQSNDMHKEGLELQGSLRNDTEKIMEIARLVLKDLKGVLAKTVKGKPRKKTAVVDPASAAIGSPTSAYAFIRDDSEKYLTYKKTTGGVTTIEKSRKDRAHKMQAAPRRDLVIQNLNRETKRQSDNEFLRKGREKL